MPPKTRAAARKTRRKDRKNVTHGHAYIKSTFNNTIVSLTDPQGAVIAWCSSGQVGFKGSRKSTPYAAQLAAEAAARANAGDDTAINRDSIGRIIHGLIDEMDDGTGWVRTSRVGDQLIKRYPDFDVRNFGSKSLNKFLASLPELEVEERILANGNPIQFVRVKPVPKPVKKPAPRRTAKRTTRKKK